jgi:hypothetical protein
LNREKFIDKLRENVQSGASGLKWYWWILVIAAFIMGIYTLVPTPIDASNLFLRRAAMPNLFGYYSHCSYAPMSTLICWIIAGTYVLYGKRAS